jgi:hypothetical protein
LGPGVELGDDAPEFDDKAAREPVLEDLEQGVKVPKLLLRAALEPIPNLGTDLRIPEVVENGLGVVELVSYRNDKDIEWLVEQAGEIGVFPLLPTFLFVVVFGEGIGKAGDHASDMRPKFLFDVVETGLSAVVFGGVVKEGCNDHVFSDGDFAAGLREDE